MPVEPTSQYGELMTLVQVAQRTGRNIVDLRRWCHEGRIPAVKVGRDWIINEADLAVIDAIPKRSRKP